MTTWQYSASENPCNDSNKKSPAAPTSKITAPTGSAAAGLPCNQNSTIESLDKDVEDDVIVLTTKTQEEMIALLVRAMRQIHAPTSSQVASGIPSGRGPVATPPPSDGGCQQTASTNNDASDISGVACITMGERDYAYEML